MITLVNQLAVSVVVTVDSVGIDDHTSPRCPVDVDDLTDNYSVQTWRFVVQGFGILEDTHGLSVEKDCTERHSWSISQGRVRRLRLVADATIV